jgi:putative CRISPR-associated protein (TIGR02619 family)
VRHTLICTAGTSLKSNLERNPDRQVWLDLYRQDKLKNLARAMTALPPDHRLLGAEINSIDSIIKRGLLHERIHLHLLVSDTPDGKSIGRLLSHYYQDNHNPCRFQRVAWQPLIGLTDENPHRFQTEGLRHLVTAIAAIARERGPAQVLINATGGYKAQISFAGLIGQALEIPVCYLFERFSEVITLPPQPVSLDLGFWLEHAPFFYHLAQDQGEANPALADPQICLPGGRDRGRWAKSVGSVRHGSAFS